MKKNKSILLTVALSLFCISVLFAANVVRPTPKRVLHSKHADHDEKDEHAEHDEKDEHADHDEKDGHEDEHGHGEGKAVGAGKAITEVDEKKGFKLSPEAMKTLNVGFQIVSGSEFTISTESLVSFKKINGVYRFRDGYFKLVDVTLLKTTKDGYHVNAPLVENGDQILIKAVGLVRIADVYSTDTSEYGHGH